MTTPVGQTTSPEEMLVLVLDDHPQMMSMYRAFLPRLLPNLKFVFTDNGIQALADFQNQKYDVVVTDINMAHIGGLELFERVRQLCQTTGSPLPRFIFCSGVGAALSEVKAFFGDETVMTLEKPFDITLLADMITGCKRSSE